MSRQRFPLPDGRFIIAGYDKPFNTWYAQLYNARQSIHEAPVAEIGYHPFEKDVARRERPNIELGPYPVSTKEELLDYIEKHWMIHTRFLKGLK